MKSLAKRIADELFTAGGTKEPHDEGDHLNIYKEGRYLAGWSKDAATDAIEKLIESDEDEGLPSSELLTVEEVRVIKHLSDAWNDFLKLDSVHPDEGDEFQRAIHAAQTLIMARPVQASVSVK